MMNHQAASTAAKALWRDTRGGTIDKVVVVALFVVVAAAGVRFLGRSSKTALSCQGEMVAQVGADGVVRCAPASTTTASNLPSSPGSGKPNEPLLACTGPGCGCFVAGTPVATEEGPQPIEEIQPGTMVLTRDERGGDLAWKPVLRTFVRPADQLMRLTLERTGGEIVVLEVTPNHRLYVDGRGWLPAGDVAPGRDHLIDDNQTPIQIRAVERLTVSAPVFNLEVADFHTYFAGQFAVWAHNYCGEGDDDTAYYPVWAAWAEATPPVGPTNDPAAFHGQSPVTLAPGSYTATTNFPVQVSQPPAHPAGHGGQNTFQSAPGVLNIDNHTAGNATLQVSAGGNLAVEVAAPGATPPQQSKIFFADPAQVAGWNATLMQMGSTVQLVPQPGMTVTFNHPTTGTQTLTRIEMQNLAHGTGGCVTGTIAGTCDGAATEILGSATTPVPNFPALLPPGGDHRIDQQYTHYYVSNALVPGAFPAPLNPANPRPQFAQAGTQYMDAMNGLTNPHPTAAQAAANATLNQTMINMGVNQYARPQVGQAFGIFRIGAIRPGADFLHGEHWGAVVASDGDTVITLENYERKAEGWWNGTKDPRYFFNIYGPGRPFHDYWGHGNAQAMTLVGESVPPDPARLGDFWNNRVHWYFGNGVATVGNYPLYAGASNRHDEFVYLLQGLAYANHVINTRPRPAGAQQNLAGWLAALQSLPAAQFPQNDPLRLHVIAQIQQAQRRNTFLSKVRRRLLGRH
ncbi:MAG: hypothetical protein QOI66_4790 [Myxococcales bacterium]|nr:hypothetical protein [Myxococcales bacterium]